MPTFLLKKHCQCTRAIKECLKPFKNQNLNSKKIKQMLTRQQNWKIGTRRRSKKNRLKARLQLSGFFYNRSLFTGKITTKKNCNLFNWVTKLGSIYTWPCIVSGKRVWWICCEIFNVNLTCVGLKKRILLRIFMFTIAIEANT